MDKLKLFQLLFKIQKAKHTARKFQKSPLLQFFINIQKAKRRNDGEVWTQPSGRKVTKKNGKIIPITEEKVLKEIPRKNNGIMKPFNITEDQYLKLHYDNKKAKILSALSKGVELQKENISNMDIDDFENEYLYFEAADILVDAIHEKREDLKKYGLDDRSTIEDLEEEFPDYDFDFDKQKYDDWNKEIQERIEETYLSEDHHDTVDKYQDKIKDIKSELLDNLSDISNDLKKESNEIYAKKDLFLKQYQHSEIHEIHGKYYFYYGEGMKGFHRPIDRELTESEEKNAKEIEDFVGDNYSNSEKVLSKIKEEISIIFKNKFSKTNYFDDNDKFSIDSILELYHEYQYEQKEQYESRVRRRQDREFYERYEKEE